jgi:hypothetical protein
MPRPERKSPRLRQYDYAANGAYFVTACTRERARLFGTVVGDEMKPNRLGRVIRSDSELRALRQYVTDNLLRWALDRENPACRQ